MTSPTKSSGVQGDIGRMRPTGKSRKFPRGPGRGATPGGVHVALTSKAVMPAGRDGGPGRYWSDISGRSCWDGVPGCFWGGIPDRWRGGVLS